MNPEFHTSNLYSIKPKIFLSPLECDSEEGLTDFWEGTSYPIAWF